MSLNPQQLVGNWLTEGCQSGWGSNPTEPSGAWKGNLVLRADGTSLMNFTSGNVARSRPGNWSLSGTDFSIIDTEGTAWRASVTPLGKSMDGDYDSGPVGAAGGNWSAQKM